jgi:predicted TIM-barrel fold metal-dependent hydrolase
MPSPTPTDGPKSVSIGPMPSPACDCHLHVYGDRNNYPLVSSPDYFPKLNGLADYRHVATVLGLSRAVLVQPSVYGFDNTMLLHTLATSVDAMCRGVVVVDHDVEDVALDRMASLGVRGVRANLVNSNGISADDALALAPRLQVRAFHLQLQIKIGHFSDLERYVARAGVPIVIDHFGLPTSCDPDARAFRQLTRLVERGLCWVKLSGYYRLYDQDVAPLVQRLIDVNPERLLWGSDWPHPGLAPHSAPDIAKIVELLKQWAPDPKVLRRILVDNPTLLYWH